VKPERASRLNLVLPTLIEILAHRDVVVVGSAPLVQPIRVDASEVLVCVNGSPSLVPDRDPDLWVVLSSRTDSRPTRTANARMIEQLSGRRVKTALHIGNNLGGPGPKTVEQLERVNCRTDRVLQMYPHDRKVLSEQLAIRLSLSGHVQSTGFVAIMLAAFCRARRIRLCGFSWVEGYHYLPVEQWERRGERGHLKADRETLEQLLDREPNRFAGPIVETLRRSHVA
jgi:hypothetical protein